MIGYSPCAASRGAAIAILLLGAAASLAQSSAPASQPARAADSNVSDVERARIAERIRTLAGPAASQPAENSRSASARRPSVATPSPKDASSPIPLVGAQAPTSQQTAPPAAAKGGCGPGGAQPALQPPPDDAPQPTLAIKTPLIEKSSWRSQPAEFEFEVANEGQGPLQIQLKGG